MAVSACIIISNSSSLSFPWSSTSMRKYHYNLHTVLPKSITRAHDLRTIRASSTDQLGDTRPKLQMETDLLVVPQLTPTNPNDEATNWLDFHGENNWAGLLDPLNPTLRNQLIRYGEMAQTTYDAYEQQPYSNNYGNCKYEPHTFFHSLGLNNHLGYNVSRYIYSNTTLPFFQQPIISRWSPTANWSGYIAVSNDAMTRSLGRRDITISWRGTMTSTEWLADMMVHLQSVQSRDIPAPHPDVKVQSGFLFLYTDRNPICPFSEYSPREQILSEVKRLLEVYKDEPGLSITLTGHSLGSAMAVLNAYDVAETGTNVGCNGKRVPICVVSYGGPRVGNWRFKERVERLGVKVIRVFNVHDRVVDLPGSLLFNETSSLPFRLKKWVAKMSVFGPWCCPYEHVGVEVKMDHKASPYLKGSVDDDLSCFHNMEVYLHLLNGYHGVGRKFELIGERDIALVNKYVDFLKDEMGIPPRWFQTENKGMFEYSTGRWRLNKGPDLRQHIKAMNSHIQ